MEIHHGRVKDPTLFSQNTRKEGRAPGPVVYRLALRNQR
jgi:hypothetical protein